MWRLCVAAVCGGGGCAGLGCGEGLWCGFRVGGSRVGVMWGGGLGCGGGKTHVIGAICIYSVLSCTLPKKITLCTKCTKKAEAHL